MKAATEVEFKANLELRGSGTKDWSRSNSMLEIRVTDDASLLRLSLHGRLSLELKLLLL